MSTIIVEVPHQSSPIAWVADSDQEIINIAYSKHGLIYESLTLQKAIDCFGEDDIPEKLSDLLKEHDKVIQVGHSSDSEFYSASDAETEIEAAKEAISHDLYTCRFLTVDEAKEFADSHSGHQGIKARIAVKKALEYV